jgi:hypothetical protein
MAFPRPFRCSSINDLSKMVPFIDNILPTLPGYGG